MESCLRCRPVGTARGRLFCEQVQVMGEGVVPVVGQALTLGYGRGVCPQRRSLPLPWPRLFSPQSRAEGEGRPQGCRWR